MRSIEAINIVRDTLRNNLADPYSYAGSSARAGNLWIFSDEPHQISKFPAIELSKVDNPSIPISIGPEYMEHEELFIDIHFYCKNGFKINVSGTEYVNSEVVEYYLSEIKRVLKSQFLGMDALGVGGYKHLNTSNVSYDENTQLYHGHVMTRVWYFNK